jgi:glycine/D-amino acid oxidase-like deaminating enzyme
MSSSTHVVVLGAGVVGASVAYHLAELGWTDVVVIDKGPIPATGGSSSHAPGLAFQTNPSRMMTQLARYTVELYMSLEHDEPTFLQVGGIEVATTRQRWRDGQRAGVRRRRGARLRDQRSPRLRCRRVDRLRLATRRARHPGTPVEIAYFGELYPARVVSESRFDPEMKRMRR